MSWHYGATEYINQVTYFYKYIFNANLFAYILFTIKFPRAGFHQ